MNAEVIAIPRLALKVSWLTCNPNNKSGNVVIRALTASVTKHLSNITYKYITPGDRSGQIRQLSACLWKPLLTKK